MIEMNSMEAASNGTNHRETLLSWLERVVNRPSVQPDAAPSRLDADSRLMVDGDIGIRVVHPDFAL